MFVISTPIGNLEDITLRALRILREDVSAIACEDTRQTQKLLDHYQIRSPLLSYHEHNETARTLDLLERLNRGESIALVSDAGTPLLSDPGYRVVTAAVENGIPVVPVPGASAALAALAASGLPTDSFRFTGFVPAKGGQRRKWLESLLSEESTVIAYESPHRILETLAEMAEVFGERRLAVARELTKIHEEFLRGTAAEIRRTLAERPSVKGEFTLVIAKGDQPAQVDDPAAEIKRLQSEEGLSRMDAIKTIAKRLNLPKREVYRLAEAERDNTPGDKHRG